MLRTEYEELKRLNKAKKLKSLIKNYISIKKELDIIIEKWITV